jgi:hypothetical protein
LPVVQESPTLAVAAAQAEKASKKVNDAGFTDPV